MYKKPPSFSPRIMEEVHPHTLPVMIVVTFTREREGSPMDPITTGNVNHEFEMLSHLNGLTYTCYIWVHPLISFLNQS